jgi:hypothetical protein
LQHVDTLSGANASMSKCDNSLECLHKTHSFISAEREELQEDEEAPFFRVAAGEEDFAGLFFRRFF